MPSKSGKSARSAAMGVAVLVALLAAFLAPASVPTAGALQAEELCDTAYDGAIVGDAIVTEGDEFPLGDDPSGDDISFTVGPLVDDQCDVEDLDLSLEGNADFGFVQIDVLIECDHDDAYVDASGTVHVDGVVCDIALSNILLPNDCSLAEAVEVGDLQGTVDDLVLDLATASYPAPADFTIPDADCGLFNSQIEDALCGSGGTPCQGSIRVVSELTPL